MHSSHAVSPALRAGLPEQSQDMEAAMPVAKSELDLMLNGKPSCTLECSDGAVPAHTEILALASPVLSEALSLGNSIKVCCPAWLRAACWIAAALHCLSCASLPCLAAAGGCKQGAGTHAVEPAVPSQQALTAAAD